MDLAVRFYDEQKKEVTTRYLYSSFISTANAVDLLAKFKEGLCQLPESFFHKFNEKEKLAKENHMQTHETEKKVQC